MDGIYKAVETIILLENILLLKGPTYLNQSVWNRMSALDRQQNHLCIFWNDSHVI